MPPASRQRIYSLTALLLLAAGPAILNSSRPSVTSAYEGTLLVTGDFSDASGFAEQVYAGLSEAHDPKDGFSLKRVPIPSDASPRSVSARVLSAIAEHAPLLIISADTSAAATSVLSATDSLCVPTIIAVATGDSLLQPKPGTAYAHVLRFVPPNQMQVASIIAWSKTHLHPPDDIQSTIRDAAPSPSAPVLVCLTDDTDYARALMRGLRAKWDLSQFHILEVPRTSRALTLFQLAQSKASFVLCFFGYYADLPDVVSLLQLLQLSPPFLLSDGCASPHFAQLKFQSASPKAPVYLCEPRPADSDNTGPAFVAVGRAIMLSIAQASRAVAHGEASGGILSGIRSLKSPQFNEFGEAVGVAFQPRKVAP